MGYSGRYHAASLMAVFIALAIGILVGIGLADDVVSTASEELENALRSNLSEAEDEAAQSELDLDRVRGYAEVTYPALVRNRLQGRQIAIVSIGGLSRDATVDITEALEPTGAEVGEVGVITRPVDLAAIEEAVPERFAGLATDEDALREFGEMAGRQLIGGGPLIEATGDQLFSRREGDFTEADSIVFVAPPPPGGDTEDGAGSEPQRILYESILAGAAAASPRNVAVARDGNDPALEPFQQADISTVDHLDQTAGRVSMVLILGGARGDYGTGEDTDGLVPEIPSGGGTATP